MKSVILLTVWAYMSFYKNSHHDFRDFNGGNFHKIRYMPKMPIFTAFPAVLMGGNSHKIRYLPKVTSSGNQMLSRRKAPIG